MAAVTVRDVPVSPDRSAQPLPLCFCHWYFSPVPVACTVKTAVFPASVVTSWGSPVMAGAATTVRAADSLVRVYPPGCLSLIASLITQR